MPKGDNNKNKQEEKLTKMLDKVHDYEQKCKWVELTIQAMGNISDEDELYSKLLLYRYVKCYTTLKTCYLLGEDRAKIKPEWDNEVMTRRTYDRYHQESLLAFASSYPGGGLLEYED